MDPKNRSTRSPDKKPVHTQDQHQVGRHRANGDQIHNRALQQKAYYHSEKKDDLTLHPHPPVHSSLYLPRCHLSYPAC